MNNRILHLCLILSVGLATTFGAHASSRLAQWPILQGSAMEYYTSGLPKAIVVYVYSSKGTLVGIINPHGHSNKQSMHAFGKTIANKSFMQLTAHQSASMAKKLKIFVQDQGYKLYAMVSHNTPYTLVLTMPKIKRTDCQAYADVENKFKHTIRQSIPMRADGSPWYSVVIIEIGSPKATITCAK